MKDNETELVCCRFCNTRYDRAVEPCWHCDAGIGNVEVDRIMLVSGEGTLRYCPHCRYDLQGNPGVTNCPECGYAMPRNWAQHRMVQNRYAGSLSFGGYTFRTLSMTAGIVLGILAICLLLGGGDLVFGNGWDRSPLKQLLAYTTAATLIASAVAVPAWFATLCVTLGNGRRERYVVENSSAPRLALSRSRLYQAVCRVAMGLLILLFVLGYAL